MATHRAISIPSKRLASSILSTDSSFQLNNVNGWDGEALESGDFGDVGYGCFRNPANTQIEFFTFDPTTVASNSITILARGLSYSGGVADGATTKYDWSANETIVELGADVPALFAEYATLDNNNSFTGVNAFTQPPTVPTPVNDTDAANKEWVLTVVNGGEVTVSQTVVSGTAGESVVAGNLVYLKAADGKWWKSDGDLTNTLNNVQLGIAQGTGNADAAITGGVLIRGIDTNQSGGAAGSIGYASNTAGGISTSSGSNEKAVGNYITASTFAFDPEYYYNPTATQKAAMAGSGGTVSSTNRFVTEDGAQVVQARVTEESGSGITAGVPVFMQSDGEASKTATVKTFLCSNSFFLYPLTSTLTIEQINISWLTDDKFAVGYVKPAGTSDPEVYVAVGYLKNDGTVGVWSQKIITTHSDSSTCAIVERLSDSKFLFTTRDDSSFSTYVCSLDANNQISVGAAVTTSSEGEYFGMSRLSDSSFVVTWRDGASDDCYVKACTVAGTVITAGAGVAFDAAVSGSMKIVGLTDAKAVVVWNTADSAITSRVANISGTTVTAGANSYNFESTAGLYIFAARLADDKFIISYLDDTTDDIVRVAVGTVAGDVITAGSPVTVVDGGASARVLGLAKFGTDGAVVLYSPNVSVTESYFSYLTISGTVPTVANTVIANLSADQSGAVSNFIAVVSGKVFVSSAPTGLLSGLVQIFEPIFNEVHMGVAKSAPVSNVVPIIQKGRTGALYSGLTFGKKYLFNQDGTISETGIIPGGVAIGTTELLID